MKSEPILTLYGGGPGLGLPEMSPFVTKTEVQLKMMGIPYRKQRSAPFAAPKGKIPYIDDGETVADSTFIRAHLERKHGVDLDRGLSPRGRAEAWAIERLIEDHLGWASVRFRWLDPASFEKGPARFFDDAPEEAREELRADAKERVRSALHAHGIGRHSPEEIAELGKRSLEALSTLLGENPYFMADHPVGVDATAFGALAGVLTPFFDTPLRREAERLPNLVAYVGRMMRRFYPEHPWK